VAPPKRKTGGRTTPAGTQPGDRVATPAKAARTAASGAVGPSARYTPPAPTKLSESPPWLPVLMLVLFVLGGVAIMLRYLVFPDSNWPMLVGLACLLGGLFTATKWR
jgi:Cell division protein CrgA